MTATGHALIGTALAVAIPNPFIGIPLAIISHIAADAFPHWDTGTNMKKNNIRTHKTKRRFVIESFIDLGISAVLPALLLIFVFPYVNPIYAFFMIIAAQGLDWATAPAIFLNWKFPPFSSTYTLQGLFDHRLDKPWGIIGQVIVVVSFLVLAQSLH